MYAIVTGGSGFIGTHLCQALARGGHRVLCVDLAPQRLGAAVAHLVADVRDVVARREYAKADAIFHLAALRSVQRSVEDPVTSVLWNVECMLAVLHNARPTARIVAASSSSVYGPNADGQASRESDATMPCSPYAASKAACESLCESWFRSYKSSIFSLRYFNVYGPGQAPGGPYAAVIPALLRAAIDGTTARIFGGAQRRAFTFVGDVVDATLRAGEWGGGGSDGFHQIVNVGGAESTSIDELAVLVERATGKPLQRVREPGRIGEAFVTRACLERARATLGWSPRVGLSDGLGRTLAAIRAETCATPSCGVGDHIKLARATARIACNQARRIDEDAAKTW